MLLAACTRRAPIASCDQDLGGVYVSPAGRVMLLDNTQTLEAYPLYADTAGPDELTVAPRVIDLMRSGPGLDGVIRKRFMRGADACEAHVRVHVTACTADRIELVLGDVLAPLSFAPCTWPRPAQTRVERWQHE